MASSAANIATHAGQTARPGSLLGRIAVVLVAVVALGLPFVLAPGQLFFWQKVSIMVVYAMTVALLVGFSGLPSFGQAAFFGIGAYSVGLLQPLRLPAPVLILCAIGAGILVALIVGPVLLRATGLAFGMLTLAFGQALYELVFVFKDATGGDNGLPGILRGRLGDVNLGLDVSFWYFGLFWVALGAAFLGLIHASPFGHTLKIIRDDPKRAQFLGIPVARYQLGAYVVAAAIGSMAGSLYALLTRIVTVDTLYWTLSGDPLVMSLIGGLYSFWGPAAGAVIFIWVQEQLSKQTAAWILYQGLIFLVFVLFLPEGLASIPARIQLWRVRRTARSGSRPLISDK